MLCFAGNHISPMETKSSKFQNDALINMRFMLISKKKWQNWVTVHFNVILTNEAQTQ